MEHLTLDQLAKYRRGGLDPATLLIADDHIESCELCRQRLDGEAAATLSTVARAISLSGDPLAPHISFERLQAYVDGNSSSAIARDLESHIEACEVCRAEVDDLRKFAAQLRSGRSRTARSWRYVAAGSLAAAVLVGAFVFWQTLARGPELAISIHDGTALIGLDKQGNLSAPAAIPQPDRQIMAAVLRDGVLPVSVNENLKSNRSVLLGGTQEDAGFHVLSPVGVTVLSATPEFRWLPLKAARSYKVEVFDSNFDLVVSSPAVPTTSWVPGSALPREKLLLWQVTADRGGTPVRAPQPPDPEARFQILGDRAARSVEAAEKMSPPSHLLLAIRFASAGLCVDALGEIAALAGANPGSPVVAQLRAEVAARCPSAAK